MTFALQRSKNPGRQMRWTPAVHELEQFVEVDPGVSSQLCSGLTLETRYPKPAFAPRDVEDVGGLVCRWSVWSFMSYMRFPRPDFLPLVVAVWLPAGAPT